MIKKLFVILLCIVLCLNFASCGKVSENKDETSSTAETSSETVENSKHESTEASVTDAAETKTAFGKFTIKDLCEHNTVSALLKNYKTISFSESKANDDKKEGCYFSYKGYPVSVERWPDNEDYSNYYSFDGHSIVIENGRYVAEIYAGPEEEQEVYYDLDYDIVIKFDFGGDLIYDLTETKDSYTFRIGYDGEKSYEDPSCKVSKFDLSIREITVNQGSDSETVTTFSYNESVEDYGFTNGWDKHNLREVTIIQEFTVNGQVADGFMTVSMPYNVEVRPYSYGDFNLWADGEWTKEYNYPGDDCDYTVYYTNMMG